MKFNHCMRHLAAVLAFVGWSATQAWAQTELIQNGSFESGTVNWVLTGGAIVDNTAGLARSGSQFAWLGGVNLEIDSCYQQIFIPADATSATLSFYYNINSFENPASIAVDFFSATIRNTANGVLATVLSKSNVNQDNSGTYYLQTFNLLPYAGQTIRVHFSSSNDSSLPTNFLIDDVSVQITEPGGNHRPVATPQTLSTDYNTSLPIILNGTDADGDLLTYSIATQPSNGSLSGSPPNVTYQPNFNFSGSDSFTFKANDGQTDSAPATVSITVNPPLAGLIINPVWDSTIENDPNAATIKNTINQAIQVYETKYSDPVTVQITFAEMGSGLGQSSTFISTRPYSTFYNALVADAKTTNDLAALAHVPGGSFDPVIGGSSIQLTLPNLRAIGINQSPGGSDSTISLNMSIINIDRNTINPSKYDLMAVVSHEIDEVLGTSSGLPGSTITPPDLFRYDSFGARNFTTSTDDAWLSFDGGVTRPVRYNQNPPGKPSGDFGDFWSTGPHTPRVQDAFGTPGVIINLGVELTLLDVIGWDLVIPAPTPTIQNVTTTGGTINFSWASAPTRGYQVQYKTNLTQANWLDLGSPVVASGPTTSTLDNISPDPRRFYRVALLPTSAAAAAVAQPTADPEPTAPITLVTRHFLPEQATQMKGQSAVSVPTVEIEPALPRKSAVNVQVRAQ